MKLRNCIVLACLAATACDPPGCGSSRRERLSPDSDSRRRDPLSPNPAPPNPAPAPAPARAPDVQFVSVAFEKQAGAYSLVGGVRNNGPGDAHFDGACNWTCPAGTVVGGGAQFISGGVLAAGGQRSYTQPASGMCAGPPAVLQVSCRLEVRAWRGSRAETESGSQVKIVNWSGQVRPPF